MTDISALKGLCNWELLSGSHEWPGPNGGTCINEAAVVVAGFPYRRVNNPGDFPPCFSRVLGAALMSLNDGVCHETRQKLIRYVTRLAGSRDVPKVEAARLRFAVQNLATFKSRSGITAMAKYVGPAETSLRAVEGVAEEFAFSSDVGLEDFLYTRLATTTRNFFCPVANIIGGPCVPDADVRRVLEVLDGMFAIGKQADPFDAATITARVAEAKASGKPEHFCEKEMV